MEFLGGRKWVELNNAIVEWHKQVFPDETLGGQLLKIEEEMHEVDDCCSSLHEEVADLYIAIIACRGRFESIIALAILLKFFPYNVFDEKLYSYVCKKLEINKARTWHKVDGVYRHVED